LIHPAGPIGFAGNYAIYRLRRIRDTDGISRVIRIANQAYYETPNPKVHVTPPNRRAALKAEAVIENEDFYSGDSYVLRVTMGVGGQLRYTVVRRNLDGPGQDITAAVAAASGVAAGVPADPLVLLFDGLRLTINGGLRFGDAIRLLAQQPKLVDPEVKYRLALEPYRNRQEIEQSLRDEYTANVVVDTTNLWLSLLPGAGSILEPFKRQHRQVDVGLTVTELARRLMRLHEGRLGDPEIDKQILINGGPEHLHSHVSAAEAASAASGNGRADGSNGASASAGAGVQPSEPLGFASSDD
jgi:hypothetical protein